MGGYHCLDIFLTLDLFDYEYGNDFGWDFILFEMKVLLVSYKNHHMFFFTTECLFLRLQYWFFQSNPCGIELWEGDVLYSR